MEKVVQAVDNSVTENAEASGTQSKTQWSFFRLTFVYSLIFIPLMAFVFNPLWRMQAGYAGATDRWTQHVKALAYYGMWLRDAGKAWVGGDFSFPTYSLSMGMGSDFYTSLQYYVVGNPLNLLSFFVSPDNTDLLLMALVILRLFLAGLVFIWVTTRLTQASATAKLMGTHTYILSGCAFVGGLSHPFFLDPMIVFPLVLYGVERALLKKQIGALVISVFFAAVVNFYFFYMVVLATIVYVIVRCFVLIRVKGFREVIAGLGRIVLGAVAGTALAAFALVPVLQAFLHSPRAYDEYVIPLLWDKGYYKSMLLSPLTPLTMFGWTSLFLGSAALVAIVVFMLSKRPLWLKVLLVLVFACFFTPIGASLFNGLAYPINRFTFLFSYLSAFLLVLVWDSLSKLKLRTLSMTIALFLIYSVLVVVVTERNSFPRFSVYTNLALLALFLSLVVISNAVKVSPKILTPALVSVATISLVFGANSSVSNYQDRFFPHSQWLAHLQTSPGSHIQKLEGGRFTRYSEAEHELVRNDSILYGLGSSSYYWSINQNQTRNYYETYGVSESASYATTSMLQRSVLSLLGGFTYYAEVGDRLPPYGYRQVEDFVWKSHGEKSVTLYKTDSAAPLGITYSQTVNTSDIAPLSLTQREELGLTYAIVDGHANQSSALPEFASKNIVLPEPNLSKDVLLKDGTIEVKQPHSVVTWKLNQNYSGELHLEFTDFDAAYDDGTGDGSIRAEFGCGSHTESTALAYRAQGHMWFDGRHNFAFNSGWCEAGVSEVRLIIEKPGIYTFDSLELWLLPMDGLEEKITALYEDSLTNIDYHFWDESRTTSEITGEITVNEPKVLVVTIPKTDGWTAYVDGKEQEILTANIMFMGLELEPGHHDIRFVYHTPGLRLGFAISVVTLVGICAVWVFQRKRRMSSSRDSEAEG